MKLGKKPAREDAVTFRFARYFDKSALPTPPLRFGRFRRVKQWGVLGNNDYGDCVWAGAAHEHMMWHAANQKAVKFSDASVLSDYADATGFNPGDPNSDQGSDMGEAASYRRKKGISSVDGIRHKIDAYVSIHAGDYDTTMLATYLFGAVGIGIQFPESAADQFKYAQPWDLKSGSRLEGGHYIPVVGRNSAGHILCVTWGRLHAMTRGFFEAYCDEICVYLSMDWLNNELISPEGYDLVALRKDQAQLRT